MQKKYISLGLMSGTSGDGVDASLIRSNGTNDYESIKDKYFEYNKEIYESIHCNKKLDLQIENNGLQIRDFIHISDVCRSITMFIQKQIKGVIDIGTGKSYHLQELLDAYGVYNIPMQEGGEGERKDNKADINQLTAIGIEPRIDVIDYLCQEKELDKSEFSKYNVTIGD